MPSPSAIAPAPVYLSRKCVSCEEEDTKALRSPRADAPPVRGVAPDLVHDVLRTPGVPLDARTRAFFEPRFGRDFVNARVHVDSRAAASARAVQARAYTVGRDIVFAAGQFAPHTSEGRSLLAHELAHVVQQGASGASRLDRMPQGEGEVLAGDYSYSPDCGWIDWGHVNPGGAATLISRVRQASDQMSGSGAGKAGAGRLDSQTMSSSKAAIVFSSAVMNVQLTRALSPDEVLAVALAIFKQLSMAFETQQEWTDWMKASSFSQEDLPSNLISFYRAARGYSKADVGTFCNALDPQASAQEYRRNHKFARNHTFDPISTTGPWPTQFAGIDDSKAASLYEVTGIEVQSRFGGAVLCPVYRLEGRIGATDLFLITVGGSDFKEADDVRVVPTYRFDNERLSGYGHFPDIEVSPMRPSDEKAMRDRDISFPLFVPSPLLVCLTSRAAGSTPAATGGTLQRSPDPGVTERALPPGTALVQRQVDEIEVDLVTVPPAEVEELRRRGINLPSSGAPVAAAPTPPSSGFKSAASGLAACPDAPALSPPAVTCAPQGGGDKPALAVPDPGRFAGNTLIAGFAHDLAACHAARVVAGEVDKRYRAAVAAARKDAKASSEAETKQAISDAAGGIDPKDRKAIAAARRDAEKTAKATAAQRLAEAETGVARSEVAAVTTELTAGFETALADDFTATVDAAIRRFGPGWLAHMQARIAVGKKRVGKPGKDAVADPEAELGRLRCEQDEWAMAQLVAVERGWMVGRREQVDFDTVPQAIKGLQDFKPSRTVTGSDLIPIPNSLQSDKSMPGVGPQMATLLTELQKVEPDFKAGNYTGHGGGGWAGAGYSVDLTLTGAGAKLDPRGFWQHDAAVRFLLSLDGAAKAAGASWRVLYNDFSVAEEVNQTTGTRNVVFMGNAPKGGLNWHGPSPMVLHFHLDMAFPAPAPMPAASP